MASKVVDLAGVGPVTLTKRKGSRNIRLSITASGVRVNVPTWVPYAAGIAFAQSHIGWIQSELVKHDKPSLENGQKIGKMHYIRFEHALGTSSTSSRVTGTEIVVKVLSGEQIQDANVQERAHKACIRSLKREAERLLPPRLAGLAAKHAKQYAAVSVKQLKRRWGSCDSNRNITLNLYLMELPWEYIDYVLLHELAHTEQMNHGPDFWQTLSAMQPRAKDLSRQLRKHQPTIGAWDSQTTT
jgi:hypothetical protein